MIYLGVDGCKTGWMVGEIDEKKHLRFRICPTITAILDLFPEASRIMIDIPIGLIDRGPTPRKCDVLTRNALTFPRSSSVFSPPCRNALYARSYAQANEINRKLTTKGLSKQAWNICDKIRKVDLFLRRNLRLNAILIESHPELCFWALNNQQAMQFNKKRAEGLHERLTILEMLSTELNLDPNFDEILNQFPEKEAKTDDIIDAWVLALTAQQNPDQLRIFPEFPPFDSQNLPMRIVYPFRQSSHTI